MLFSLILYIHDITATGGISSIRRDSHSPMKDKVRPHRGEYPDGLSSGRVVIASGTTAYVVDAVTATPLAKAPNALTLLSPLPEGREVLFGGEIPVGTIQEIIKDIGGAVVRPRR